MSSRPRGVATLVVALLLSACSGGGPTGDGGPDGGGGPGDGNEPSDDGLFSFDLPAGPTMRPSGAEVRLVNLYRDVDGNGVTVDVYPGNGLIAGETALASVPYATASDWFDPLVFDESGNAALTWAEPGMDDQEHKIGTQTETLTGGERITFILGSGENLNAAGGLFGSWRPVFESDTVNFPVPTALPVEAVVIVDALALQYVEAFDDEFTYVSLGDGCLFRLDHDEFEGPQPMSGGTSSAFGIPTGSRTLSIHPEGMDCGGESLVDVPLDLATGERAYVLLHTPDGENLEALVVPIE